MFGSILDWIRDLIRWLTLPWPIQLPPPAGCPIGWQPSVVAPVMYGTRDYRPREPLILARFLGPLMDHENLSFGPPTSLRVFYPSLQFSPIDASILEGCGGYPLIVFAHGHCPSDPADSQYKRWVELPARLARSGFVVAVPMLPSTAAGSHPSTNDGDLDLFGRVVAWMRPRWEHAAVLTPVTAVIGHSYGGMLAGRYADEATSPVSAFASLTSGWKEWQPGVFPRDSPLPRLTMPKLIEVGGLDSDASVDFASLTRSKHGAVLKNADHWDFLPAGRSPCVSIAGGSCANTWALAADVACLFFGKYLPLDCWPNLSEAIPDTLEPPKRRLTFHQAIYASGHLRSFSLLGEDEDCGVTLAWSTPDGDGSVTRPRRLFG